VELIEMKFYVLVKVQPYPCILHVKKFYAA
jgi:hypothetical protein